MTTSDLLFSCLRHSVGGMAMSGDEQGAINDQSLDALYKLSAHHDLAHLVCDALQKSQILPGNSIGQAFQRQKDLAIYRYILQSAVFDEMCRIFENAEIVFVPLKGSVIRSFYPEPWMRTSCDIDILVHEEDLEQAIAVLTDQLKLSRTDEIHYRDISLRSSNGIHVELHHHIKSGKSSALDKVLETVWENAAPAGPGLFQYQMNNEFFMFHQLAHMSYHFISGGCGIRPFLDHWVMNDHLALNWETLNKLLERGEIKQFTDVISSLTTAWFSSEYMELSAIDVQIQEYILQGGVYGTEETSIRSQQARKGGTAKNIFGRIWLPYEVLVNYYGAPPGRKHLQPVYEARRWLDALSKREKRQNWGRKLKENISVTQDKRGEMKQILEHLGLFEQFIDGQ